MENTQVITETKWTIDKSHCEIGFKVRHLMISNVKGTFLFSTLLKKQKKNTFARLENIEY